MITEQQLSAYLGKSIAEICPNGFTTDAHNHSAHFVGHALGYTFGATCHLIGSRNGPAATLRTQEIFRACPKVGVWSLRPSTLCHRPGVHHQGDQRQSRRQGDGERAPETHRDLRGGAGLALFQQPAQGREADAGAVLAPLRRAGQCDVLRSAARVGGVTSYTSSGACCRAISSSRSLSGLASRVISSTRTTSSNASMPVSSALSITTASAGREVGMPTPILVIGRSALTPASWSSSRGSATPRGHVKESGLVVEDGVQHDLGEHEFLQLGGCAQLRIASHQFRYA